MMRRVYCIYDMAAQAPINGILQCMGTDDEAMRMFRQVVVTEGTVVCQHPADFAVCCIGVINYDDMVFTPIDFPLRSLLTGDAVVRDLRARSASVPDIQPVPG